MSPRHGARIPSRGDWGGDSGWEVAHLLVRGDADHVTDELTDAEARALRKEKRERLKRKRPVGFAPWPEADGDVR